MIWEEKTLKDVCELIYGKGLSKRNRIRGEYPVYGSAGIVGSHQDFLVHGPGIIVGRKGSVGTVYYEKRNFYPIDTVYYVVPKDAVDIRFLYYVVKSLNLYNLNTDSAVPGLNRNVAYEQIVKLPNIAIQSKIANVLSPYDDMIENNLRRIRLLEEEALCHYELMIKRKSMNPKTPMQYGIVITGKTPSTKNSTLYGIDIPFIKTPDMHDQVFIENTQQNLSIEGANSQKTKFIPPYSLCVSCIGTAGVVGITSKTSQTNQQINSIVFSNPDYAYFFYFAMKKAKEQLEALGSNGATFTNVNKSKFESMPIMCPDEEDMVEFAEKVKLRFDLILNLQRQNDKLREARDILLPRQMNGEIEL